MLIGPFAEALDLVDKDIPQRRSTKMRIAGEHCGYAMLSELLTERAACLEHPVGDKNHGISGSIPDNPFLDLPGKYPGVVQTQTEPARKYLFDARR